MSNVTTMSNASLSSCWLCMVARKFTYKALDGKLMYSS